jgi:hypothetical protein
MAPPSDAQPHSNFAIRSILVRRTRIEQGFHSVIARSSCDEAIQPRVGSGLLRFARNDAGSALQRCTASTAPSHASSFSTAIIGFGALPLPGFMRKS